MNSGTSMSCPIAAGAATLVRQYFVGGFYADDVTARGGLCSGGSFSFACTAFSPSGALVKVCLGLVGVEDGVGGGWKRGGECILMFCMRCTDDHASLWARRGGGTGGGSFFRGSSRFSVFLPRGGYLS